MKKYVCDVCAWEYDEELGDPENGIAPGTAWEDETYDATKGLYIQLQAMDSGYNTYDDTDFKLYVQYIAFFQNEDDADAYKYVPTDPATLPTAGGNENPNVGGNIYVMPFNDPKTAAPLLAAVYLAAVLAGHAQKGLPAFGIYGHEVQDTDMVDTIPEDVKEKLLRFGRAAIAVATMRGKSYLQIGSQCMGIAGSIIDQDFMEEYFGMRVESVDEVEILRRMEEGIYNEEEYQKALKWTKEHCKEGRDDTPETTKFLGEDRKIKFTDEEKENLFLQCRKWA